MKTLPTLILAQAAPEAQQIVQVLEDFDFTKLFIAAFYMVVAWGINRFIQTSLDRLGEGSPRRRLLFKKLSSFARLFVFVLAGWLTVMVLLEGQDTVLLGLTGSLAVAVGFALKDTVSSLMSGILILVDQPFQVGDRVQFGETYGEVKEIGLRAVRITTLDDNEVTIPNNKFLTEAVSCGNSGALDMMMVIPFHIAASEDYVEAKKIIYEACVSSKYTYLKKPVVVHVRELEAGKAFATKLELRAYVNDVKFESAMVTDITERVKSAFRESGVQMPYTRQLTVRTDRWIDLRDVENRAD